METIKQLITDGKTDEAIRLLDEYIEKNTSSDEAYYLRGNAYRKKGDIRQALNNYLTAMELNSDSPAQIAHDQLIELLQQGHVQPIRKAASITDTAFRC